MKKIFSVVKRFVAETDKVLTLLITAASVFGIFAVYSATRYTLEDGQKLSRDALVMLIAAAAGIVIMMIVSAIDYELIMKLWPLIGAFCLVLMVVTLLFGAAPESRPDSRCWLAIGPVYFQSSELLKIGFIITFSMHLDMINDSVNKPLNLLLLAIHAAIPVGLVVLTGDMGSALVFILIAIAMLFLGGIKLSLFAAGGILVLAASPLVWMFVFGDFQKNRFLALLRPEEFPAESYQQLKGLNALGSGGFFGQGIFKGAYTQSGLVPESQNDMIFTVIGEETGFFGCLCALGLLFLIVWKMYRISKKARDFSTQLVCWGMAAMIVAQVIINIGMCLMVLPVIGITLPFYSAGGSSTLCLYIGLGLVLSIARFNKSREMVNFRLSRISTPFSEF